MLPPGAMADAASAHSASRQRIDGSGQRLDGIRGFSGSASRLPVSSRCSQDTLLEGGGF